MATNAAQQVKLREQLLTREVEAARLQQRQATTQNQTTLATLYNNQPAVRNLITSTLKKVAEKYKT